MLACVVAVKREQQHTILLSRNKFLRRRQFLSNHYEYDYTHLCSLCGVAHRLSRRPSSIYTHTRTHELSHRWQRARVRPSAPHSARQQRSARRRHDYFARAQYTHLKCNACTFLSDHMVAQPPVSVALAARRQPHPIGRPIWRRKRQIAMLSYRPIAR